MFFYTILAYNIIIKHKKLCKNNKFEMPAQMWNKGFQLTDRSYPT